MEIGKLLALGMCFVLFAMFCFCFGKENQRRGRAQDQRNTNERSHANRTEGVVEPLVRTNTHLHVRVFDLHENFSEPGIIYQIIIPSAPIEEAINSPDAPAPPYDSVDFPRQLEESPPTYEECTKAAEEQSPNLSKT